MSGKIAVYIRFSLADEDTGKTKSESDSIDNQCMLINHFIDVHPVLSAYSRAEFVDDGYTGTNFDRPQFQTMMNQVLFVLRISHAFLAITSKPATTSNASFLFSACVLSR